MGLFQIGDLPTALKFLHDVKDLSRATRFPSPRSAQIQTVALVRFAQTVRIITMIKPGIFPIVFSTTKLSR
jgi:hypothetical protein